MWIPELDGVSLGGIKVFKPCFAVRKPLLCDVGNKRAFRAGDDYSLG